MLYSHLEHAHYRICCIMEASSPLAALQHPSMLPPWGRKDFYSTHRNTHLSGTSRFGPGAFNFRDLSMKRNNPDHFGMGPVRGSSPTASLAADLSQNFHIDMRYVSYGPQERCWELLISYKPATAHPTQVALYLQPVRYY